MFNEKLSGDWQMKRYGKGFVLSSRKYAVTAIFAEPTRENILEFTRNEERRRG